METVTATLRKFYDATFAFDAPYMLYYWGGLVVLLLILVLICRIRRSRRNFRVYRDESGVAETTDSALRDLVRLACDGVETASKPKIHFAKKHGRINILIRAKLYQGQRLSEVRDAMRRSVTKTFHDTHGILVGDVSFLVTGFKKGSGSAYEPEAPMATLPAEPRPKSEPELAPVVVMAEPQPEEEDEAVEEKPRKKGGFFGFGRKHDEPVESEEDEAPAEDSPDKKDGEKL